MQEIEEVVESAPGIVQDAEQPWGASKSWRVRFAASPTRFRRLQRRYSLRVEMRVEVAGTIAFATVAAERYVAGNDIGTVGFSALAGLFFLAFVETLVKKKRDLGHFL